jgi:hypothetical protein
LINSNVGKLTVTTFLELEGERNERCGRSRGKSLRRIVGLFDVGCESEGFVGSGEVETNTVENSLHRLVGEC